MKRFSVILLVFFSVFISLNAQYQRDSIWRNDILNFQNEDSKNGIKNDVVLFVGSSTFTKWKSIYTDFPNSNVINRAFGGSVMTDLIYYFNQIVVPYNPTQIVIYEGDNDLTSKTKTVESFIDDFNCFIQLIRVWFPSTDILVISIKPSPSRTAYFTKFKEANSELKQIAEKSKDIKFIDIWDLMLNADGTLDKSLYLKDMLHMNSEGYSRWKSKIEPDLIKRN